MQVLQIAQTLAVDLAGAQIDPYKTYGVADSSKL